MTSALESQWIEATLSSPFYQAIPEQKERFRRRYEATPAAASMPAYDDRLIVDTTGRLWVRRYAPPWETDRTWSVFDDAGRWLGDVAAPPGLEIVEICADHALGRRTDELGVEYVQLHRLVSAER